MTLPQIKDNQDIEVALKPTLSSSPEKSEQEKTEEVPVSRPMTLEEKVAELQDEVHLLYTICEQLYWTASRQYSAPGVYTMKLELDKRYKLSSAQSRDNSNNRT